jgi:hypothetical protein
MGVWVTKTGARRVGLVRRPAGVKPAANRGQVALNGRTGASGKKPSRVKEKLGHCEKKPA